MTHSPMAHACCMKPYNRIYYHLLAVRYANLIQCLRHETCPEKTQRQSQKATSQCICRSSQELSWSELDPRPETGRAKGAPHLDCPTSTCFMSSLHCHRIVKDIFLLSSGSWHLRDHQTSSLRLRVHLSRKTSRTPATFHRFVHRLSRTGYPFWC